MEHLGYESFKADPDVWMWSATRTDGRDYYKYILLYVDDCVRRSEAPQNRFQQMLRTTNHLWVFCAGLWN